MMQFIQQACFWMLSRLQKAFDNDDGVATVEILLVTAVLIALALMFKDTIIDFVSGLLSNISTEGTSFNPATMVP